MLRRFHHSTSLVMSAAGANSSTFISTRHHQAGTGVGGPGSRKSSWTALLDDDEEAQVGNKAKETISEKAFRSHVLKETPPELRDSYINTQRKMHPDEQERILEEAKLEAMDRASQLKTTLKRESKQQERRPATNIPAAAAAYSGTHSGLWEAPKPQIDDKSRSFYGGVNEEETAAMNRRAAKLYSRDTPAASHERLIIDPAAASTIGQHRPRRGGSGDTAMSRFFRDSQARDFAAKKYEDEDKAKYSGSSLTFDEAMKQSGNGFGGEASMMKNEQSPTHSARVMLDQLDQTGTAAAGNFSTENPYDSYRNLAAQKASDSSFEMAEQTQANRSVIPGLGPLLDTIYWRIEQASEYKINKPQIGDKELPFYKRVFADIDVTDKRQCMHVLTNYWAGEWLFALLSAAAVFFMTDYQYRNRTLETYDEILGLDVRRGGERLEYIFVLISSFMFYRFLLFQPMVLSCIGVTRFGRFMTGRPLGPP